MTFENSILLFNIPSLGAKYEGRYDNGQFKGTFTQSGASFALNLTATNEEPIDTKRPQEPSEPYPYISENITFDNPQNGIKLAGTFTYPATGDNFPVAILVSGSGAQNRNEELLGHKPFLVIADYLTRNGIAVLRYDDRGVGDSEGIYATATIEDFATDAAAAVKHISTRKEIDPKRIGVIGHSEGGSIAFMLASDKSNNLSYIISLAGMAM